MAKFLLKLSFSLTSKYNTRIISKRSIMTSLSRAEKALENLKGNAYYEKYAEKIAKLQQTSPEEFMSRIEDLETKKKPKSKTPSGEPSKQKVDSKFSQLLNPKQPLTAQQPTEDKPLDSIMKVDLIKDKTTEEIKAIWHSYHKDKNYISAVMPAEDYELMKAKAKEHPTFLLPLPREQGYEFIMCQFDHNSVHFTPLLYYQVHKENAPECLTMTHYTEFSEDKKIVLMRGEYDQNVINCHEAQCLANELRLYYINPTDEKLKLLETFTKKPDSFKHMDLIKQVETLSL